MVFNDFKFHFFSPNSHIFFIGYYFYLICSLYLMLNRISHRDIFGRTARDHAFTAPCIFFNDKQITCKLHLLPFFEWNHGNMRIFSQEFSKGRFFADREALTWMCHRSSTDICELAFFLELNLQSSSLIRKFMDLINPMMHTFSFNIISKFELKLAFICYHTLK